MIDHFLGEASTTPPAANGASKHPRLRWDILDAFREPAAQYGIPPVNDFNTGDNEGSGYFHVNQKRGRRWSAARGFLKPVLHRQNLRLETGCLVEGLEFDGKRARPACAGGRMACAQRALPRRGHPVGRLDRLAASLMLSGVGPAAQLVATRHSGGARQARRRRQPARPSAAAHDLQGVGREDPERNLSSLLGRAGMGLDYALRRRGPLTMAPSQLGAFTRSDPIAGSRQYPVSRAAALARQVRRPAASVSGLHRQRRQFAADQPRRAHAANRPIRPRAPAIKPNYLATPEDRRVAADSIRVTRKIVAQPALAEIFAGRISAGRAVRDDDEAALDKAAGDIGTTIFHPVGTARMGRDDDTRRRGRCAPARHRHRWLARDRCLGDAVDHLRQHQFADHDDRREGRGDDFGGSKALID